MRKKIKKRNHNKENNPHWNGGRFVDCRGYAFVLIGDKYIGEHRLVVEQHLGRRLDFKEKIHHINGNPYNNDVDNLQALCHDCHKQLHQMEYVDNE